MTLLSRVQVMLMLFFSLDRANTLVLTSVRHPNTMTVFEGHRNRGRIDHQLDNRREIKKQKPLPSSGIGRRTWMSILIESVTALYSPIVATSTARAAPPISVIAEELGYFPVTNKAGETVFIPSKVKRSSTQQSIEFSKYLQQVPQFHSSMHVVFTFYFTIF